ncbi:MAG TPA: hypothetical protein VGN49_06595 [Micrococcaceae bacterium]|jgi:hypothetical protein|nr:hypothetical protein [Micrococcaceae bacterium]
MKKLHKLSAVVALLAPLAGAIVLGAGPASAATTGCLPATKANAPAYPGTVLVNDTFETGSLLPEFKATAQGTGTATVSKAAAQTGACSAYLHVTNDSGSLANVAFGLAASTKGYYADGWFNITVAGVAGNDVPYFRWFSGANRIADIYRYNSNGQLWLRVTAPSGAFVYTKLVAGNISLSVWHHVQMHIIPNGNATTIQVSFDGKSVYSSSTVSTSATSLTTVQLGAEHYRQMGDSFIDNVIIQKGQ